MLMVDQNGRVLVANAEAERLFGYAPGELGGQVVEMLVPERFRHGHPELRMGTFHGGTELMGKGRRMGTGRALAGVRKDGNEIPVEIGINLVDTAEGMCALVTVVDIAERQCHLRALETHGAQQAAVAQLGLYALSEPDVGRLVAVAIRALAEHLHIERAEVLTLEDDGETLLLTATVGREDGAIGSPVANRDLSALARRALQSREPAVAVDLPDDPSFRGAPSLGSCGVGSGVAVVIEGREAPYGVLAAHSTQRRDFAEREISFVQAIANLLAAAVERERIEAELRESRQMLASAELEEQLRRTEHLAALGTLAGGIAHEINNPLNSILMNAEFGLLSLDRKCDPTVLVHVLQTIVREAKRCGQITNGVSRFAKAVDGPRESHDLNAVVRRSTEIVMSYFRTCGVRLKMRLDDSLLPVSLDAAMIEQAVANLLRNAAESGASCVQVWSERCGDAARLSICDDGPGITPEDQRRVFDPFFSSRRPKGAVGLGLSVVYRIVTDHGGTIRVHSESGGGATFVVELPLDGVRAGE